MVRTIFIFFLFIGLFALDESKTDEVSTRSIDFGYSDVAGSGIGYRYYDNDGYIELRGIAIYEDRLNLSFGASKGEYFYKRYFRESSFAQPFALKYHYGAALSYGYESSLTAGLGVGIEFGNPLIKGFIYEFVVDYIAGYEQYEDSNNSASFIIKPSVSFAIGFNF